MLPALKTLLQETLKILWLCGRYLGVCAILVFGLMSLATGKFPPPVKDVYQSLQAFQSSINIGKATRGLASAQAQQKQILAALEDNGTPMPESGAQVEDQTQPKDANVVGMGVNAVSDKERIKALEYEVALLKAKLARAESETYQLQVKQASARQ